MTCGHGCGATAGGGACASTARDPGNTAITASTARRRLASAAAVASTPPAAVSRLSLERSLWIRSDSFIGPPPGNYSPSLATASQISRRTASRRVRSRSARAARTVCARIDRPAPSPHGCGQQYLQGSPWPWGGRIRIATRKRASHSSLACGYPRAPCGVQHFFGAALGAASICHAATLRQVLGGAASWRSVPAQRRRHCPAQRCAALAQRAGAA